jgi:hypothetical protein
MSAKRYDEATLSIVCPVCCAAVTAKCLTSRPTGGLSWMYEPHAERVIAAHPPVQKAVTELDMWGDPPRGE